ncbi:hypothetical protein RCG19_15915 [Neobacillus sp. OS1-2]|uniref:hypothetical protein n=1 Tax=Neobacillus sp. OS1-2 TaxID=3070680 RepID=UPI0027DFC6C2|nr:hypothetical protein [Neobacillus sp. OS1-2]WML38674.1 hypothetical protein RCG19_15915 [Neobacillus sp. OS1-2]
MINYTRTKVLLPERITKERDNWTNRNFDFIVRNYLLRYPGYQLIRVEGPFAICERADAVKVRRKRNG